MKEYRTYDLDRILNLYKADSTRGIAIAQARGLFNEIINNEAKIAESAYDNFQQFLNTFYSNDANENGDDEEEPIDSSILDEVQYRFDRQKETPRIANQNVSVYTNDELQEMLDLYKDEATRDEAITQAKQFWTDYQNDTANVGRDPEAIQLLAQITNTFHDYLGQTENHVNEEEQLDTPAEQNEDKPQEDENVDVKKYSNQELQDILDRNSSDEAKQFLTDFVNKKADVEDNDDALKLLQQIIDTFGVEMDEDGNPKQDENGDPIYDELGKAAIRQLQSAGVSLENAIQSVRINSMTSDENQMKFDSVKLKIYKELGLVTINTDNMTAQQIAETVDSVKLDDADRTKFYNRFYEVIIDDNELLEIAPPRLLADIYTFLQKQLQERDDDVLSFRLNVVRNRIDSLIRNFPQRVNYFYSDPSNIADIYDGYQTMCTVRRKGLNEEDSAPEYKKQINDAIDETMRQLEEVVKTYSEMWNLRNLHPENAEELDARWREISEKLKGVELSDEMLAILAKYKFLDENGQPIPQFLDENQKPQVDYQPGYTLNPNGRLYRIISLAKTDVTMRNVGDLDTPVQDMDLESELSNRIPWKMAEISVVDQAIQDAEQNPRRMLNEQEVNEIWDEIRADGGQISDTGYQAALDAQVNQAAGWAGMMANRVGSDKPIVMRPFEAVQDIDKLASTRTERIGAEVRKTRFGLFKRIAKNFGAAAITSIGIGIIGHATGAAVGGAVIGTALGIGNMVYQGFKWRKEQIALNKPHGIRDFFADKRNWGPAVASGLGIAAVISMASGAPELSGVFGAGAIAIGGGSAAKATYDDALASGYSKRQAIAAAVGVMAATVAGGLIIVPMDGRFPNGVGTMGIYEPRQERKSGGFLTRMRERIGALADRASGMVSQDDDNHDKPHDDDNDRPHDDDTPPHDSDDRPPHGGDDRPNDDDTPPHNDDTGRDGEGNTTGGSSRSQSSSTRRGFFGKCKDVTYKIARSVYHGLQKIQKGVSKMSLDRIKNENERKKAKQDGVHELNLNTARHAKELLGEYDGVSLDQLTELAKEQIAARSLELEGLIKRLAARRLKLTGRGDRAVLREQQKTDTEVEEELRQLKIYEAQLKKYHDMGGDLGMEDVRKYHELKNKIELLDVEGENDVNLRRAEGRTAERAELGRGDLVRGIEAYKAATEILREKLTRKQIRGAGEIYDAAKEKLKAQLKDHDYSEEDLNQITEAVLTQALADLQHK